jgi:hypothetical protein|tara:strand:- start:1076 stop:1921 length:846 start_codon:yes stop_codon:yes gene_type:complete
MTTIKPVNNELNDLVKTVLYRTIVNQISEKYSVMDGFINNLTSDINEISNVVGQLNRDRARGYDIGTSLDTLGFQKDTMTLDKNFFVKQKDTYLKKIYKDLYKYTEGIIDKCIEIENNPMDLSDSEIKTNKFSGAREYDEDESVTYVMSDVFALLSVTERNLFELSSDIATFSERISAAENNEKRGFSVGNLILNLKEQQSSLTFAFKSYCARLEQFLKENYKFSTRCVKRIEMISSEIVTDEELAQLEKDAEAAEKAKNQDTADANTDGDSNTDNTPPSS